MTGDLEVTTAQLVLTEPTFASNSTLDQPSWSLPWRIALTLSLAAIMCAAVIGNLLVVVVVIRNRGMRTRTNMFLCNLAIADLLCAVIDMPFSLITVASGRWIFDDVVCKLNGFALPFLFVASIHTLMYMSMHKYLSLASPFRRSLSTRCVVLMMTGAWLWAAVAGASTVSPLTDVVYKPGAAQCGPQYPSDVASFVHFFFVVVTCYAIPMIVVAVCNSLTFAVIRGHGIRMRLHSTEEWRRIGSQQRHIAVTLLLVVVSFAIAWTPWVVYAFYVIFAESRDVQPPAVINPITYWCIYLNSVCNPVIYALRSEAFREGYKQVFCRGSTGFASEMSGSQRSTMTRYCIDKVEGTTSSAAILNSAVKFSVDSGSDSRWASLDHYGRRRRSRRLLFSDDEREQDNGCQNTNETVDDEVSYPGVEYQETVPSTSLTSAQAAVEGFDDSLIEQFPVGRQGIERTPAALCQQYEAIASDIMKSATPVLPLSQNSGSPPDTAVGSSLASRASSEGDVLSGVEVAEATVQRSSRLASCASVLFGRFVTPKIQRLTTVSGVEWRRRCDVALKQHPLSSTSFYDTATTSTDCGKLSEQPGAQTVAATPAADDEYDEMSITPMSQSIDLNSNRGRSQRRVGDEPTLSSTSARHADTTALDVPDEATVASATWDQEALRRTTSWKKRPTIRRYPSVERLDLPRRRESETFTSGKSGADRKRDERFRRQYIDVKLQRATPLKQPTSATKSMPAGVDVCGTMTRHDITARPQLLHIPASANVALRSLN